MDVLRPPRNLGSKARAQNCALPYCTTDLVLPVDADTILAPEISIWAIQRDNGGCPGTIDSNSCSGIKQPTWAFSHIFDGYTR